METAAMGLGALLCVGTTVLMVAVVVVVVVLAVRHDRRAKAARSRALAVQADALGLVFLGEPAELPGAAPPARLLLDKGEHHNVIEGLRAARLVTLFDRVWTASAVGRARNVVSTDSDGPDTFTFTLVWLRTEAGLPSFLLEPNAVRAARQELEKALPAAEAEGWRGLVRSVAVSIIDSVAPDTGLRFPEEPGFHETFVLTTDEEAATRTVFAADLLRFLMQRPGWVVESLPGHLLVSVCLDRWPPTASPAGTPRRGMEAYLPPDHLPALVDGALEIARELEAAARRLGPGRG